MKNLPVVILMLILSAFLVKSCDPENEEHPDLILYQDINPDTTLAYEIEVLNQDPYKCQGDFSYPVDLDQDGTDDFEISGSTWPGHFDHVGVMWYNDHETKVVALHQNAFIALSTDHDMCCETALENGDPIGDQFQWADKARISFVLTESFVGCSWNSDYLAIKLVKEGHSIFGWIDLDGNETPTVKDMAVNLTVDKKILAGQKE